MFGGQRIAGSSIATAAVVASLALLPVGAAAAPPAIPLAQCPPTAPTAALSPGQPAIGYTVRRGEAVETFDVEILDVMEGGAGSGRDIIIVEARGPVIDEGGADRGGISAGMSGSPVYTLDGALIGAIAYGFAAGPSPIGGITPIADMAPLLDEGPRSRSRSVRLDPEARAAARAAGAERRQVRSGLSSLPLPLTVSGGLGARRVEMLREAAARRGAPLLVAGGASARSLGPLGGLVAGDAVAAALSFGDATMAATGTTTYVCNGRMLAFGHPFLHSGPTLVGAARAKVLAVIDDDAQGPYKLAAPVQPVGVFDTDRLAGIGGRLGVVPPTFPILQDTRALDTGRARRGGRTDVVRSEGEARLLLPEVVLSHITGNIDSTFDQTGAGGSLVSWALRGVNERSGKPFTLERRNRFASDEDISFESAFEAFEAIVALEEQRVAPVRYTGLDVDVRVRRDVRSWQIGRVRWAVGSARSRDVERLRARPGQRIRAEVPLRSGERGSPKRTVKMSFRVPKRARSGRIKVEGMNETGGEDAIFCLLYDDCPEGEEGGFKRLGSLLESLGSAPRNDELRARSRFRGSKGDRRSRLLGRVVSGSDSVRVSVRR